MPPAGPIVAANGTPFVGLPMMQYMGKSERSLGGKGDDDASSQDSKTAQQHQNPVYAFPPITGEPASPNKIYVNNDIQRLKTQQKMSYFRDLITGNEQASQKQS